MILLFTLITALVVDHFIGEPSRFHPLVIFGNLANKLEKKFNKGSHQQQLVGGLIAWGLLVLPLPLLYLLLLWILPVYLILLVNIYIVYWAVALNSLIYMGCKSIIR